MKAYWFGERLIVYALLLTVLFLATHLLGFREHVGILSGTSSLNVQDMFFGSLYLLLYLGFVVLAPIMLLAGIFVFISAKLCSR